MELISVILISCVSSVIANFCYWNTGCPYKYLSSETPYNLVRGDIRDSVVKLKDCEPVSIWGIYRHGKRYPEAHIGKGMQEAVSLRKVVISSYESGRSSLCAQDVENLQNWQYDAKMFEDKEDITEEGRLEMLFLGKRLKKAFPNILNEQNSTTFRSSKGMWLENSIKEFVRGLGIKDLVIDPPKTEFDDIAPYLSCEKSVGSNPNTEVEKYLNTSDYLVVKDRIKRRTGLDMLKDENVIALYNLCRYTWSGIDSKTSPWCALFTKDDLQVLEYEEDLRHYYTNGYGLSINEISGGMPLADLWRNFDKVRNGEGKKLVAYVTHAKTLHQVYTALGLFKDTNPLTAAKRDGDRKWRSSVMSVFSGNLVAVLNKCSNTGVEEYNIVFYLNEEPIRSICADGVCSWQEFEYKFRPFVNTNFDFCQVLS